MEFKRNAATPIIANNNTFLRSNYKCCVMYFIKKVLLLPNVLAIICKPCGFSITECNTFFCSSFNHMMEMCVSNMCCEGLETNCISFGSLCQKCHSMNGPY